MRSERKHEESAGDHQPKPPNGWSFELRVQKRYSDQRCGERSKAADGRKGLGAA